MGIVDWDNNGIEPHEVGITTAVAATLLSEADRAETEAASREAERAERSSDGAPDGAVPSEPGVSCGCIVAILLTPVIYVIVRGLVLGV